MGPRFVEFIALGVVLAVAATLQVAMNRETASVAPVTIAGEVFTLDVARTPREHADGLSDRPGLDASGGMLFIYQADQVRTFWMRHCLVPLDLVFLDASGRVVSWHTMPVEPYDTPPSELTRYSSGEPCRFAIELRAGTVDRLALGVGDRVDLPWLLAGSSGRAAPLESSKE